MRWQFYPKQSDDLIEQLLINRGIDLKERERFLNPKYSDFFDPFLLPDMNKAVLAVREAIKKGLKIGIFSDYDADGTPAAAFLKKILEKLGAKTEVYIPRREEGYGLNQKGILELKSLGCRLIVACDLGITNNFEVNLASKAGMKVIILDHHLLQEEKYPQKAAAVVHTLKLCGGGIAFKLASALELEENFLKWQMDLPAISTITDMVPLISENRLLAKFGLLVLSKTKNLGLQKLYEAASINPENLAAHTVSFQIGPRLNAPGRMNHTNISFHLLISEDKEDASNLALQLNQINQQRQTELERVVKEARKEILTQKLQEKKVIVVAGEGWPAGIVGVAASRLMEEFCRPAFVLRREKEILRGSARSIDNFPLVDILEKIKDCLLQFGGHTKAAGVVLVKNNLETFYDALLKEAEKRLKPEDLEPRLKVDLEIQPEKLNFEFLEQISAFEPHGLGNPRPVLVLKNVRPSCLRIVGKEGQHLKMKINGLDIIGFGLGPRLAECENSAIDIAFNLSEDNYNGANKVQLKALDFKKS
ncbi:single-stranded-DNA-specific exonuclease RecJ [Candidatus Berkelbacteria bacterium]|nr:single-stranded-DNA-specific exonuclease RecJ [Candidatus Berkelbacteria bacterium]